ncbi:hypothetical protein HLB23_27120 [Nocardia uniformis]|uniref:Uncharacterized protein n=1 Tax=Nocardia uniformis TaxID=53432 RepID=A0A849C461_9NOCA|nr:hypothetical protein [Nocardia uniformis]NNH73484.1 hypothetical protein [Nocardia uniformis]
MAQWQIFLITLAVQFALVAAIVAVGIWRLPVEPHGPTVAEIRNRIAYENRRAMAGRHRTAQRTYRGAHRATGVREVAA